MDVYATDCKNFITIGSGPTAQKICGPLEGINSIADVINKVVAFVIPLAAIILFLVLVWGGFSFLTSAGDPEKVKSARAKITSALIGFLILVFAFVITKLMSRILGFTGFF